jgi:hypothetical protein
LSFSWEALRRKIEAFLLLAAKGLNKAETGLARCSTAKRFAFTACYISA